MRNVLRVIIWRGTKPKSSRSKNPEGFDGYDEKENLMDGRSDEKTGGG